MKMKQATFFPRVSYFHPRTCKKLAKDIDSAIDERNCKTLIIPSDMKDFKVEIEKKLKYQENKLLGKLKNRVIQNTGLPRCYN